MDRTYHFAESVAAATTVGSSIRPIPEGAIALYIVRNEDDEGRNTQSFTVLLTREQAKTLGTDMLRASADLPLRQPSTRSIRKA